MYLRWFKDQQYEKATVDRSDNPPERGVRRSDETTIKRQ